MPLPDPREDMELMRNAAVAAGILATSFFRRDVKHWTKDNASPVTEADLAVDRYLEKTLTHARPDYGWLSEETADDPQRLDAERVFIVDPIDGTRGFMRGDDNWSISMAVVENGEPIAGLVYVPIRDELYEAIIGDGVLINGHPLERRQHHVTEPVIPAPGAVHRALAEAGLDYVRGPHTPSLAYRLVQVATGVFDATAARRGAQDWDIAAAALILSESGVIMEDVCAGPLRFNGADPRHGALMVSAVDGLAGPLREALKQVYGCPDDSAVDASIHAKADKDII
ncbi:3'(2'),5'-bisphosphate nucleotidase CysQ [Cucumibacter marinus]|uniref:3'(2'),5'-bisphosphate nucleotidase CysQ n=1 Tax=Cucumibacter marinus TaxID=1121252 RepID=UPI000419EFD7|nr:3'(2'),5'-bisphosphate nucleotidase CysQ [Cucumibacter marinus]